MDKNAKNQQWKLWIGLAISIVALILAVRGIDIRQIADTLQHAEYIYLAPAAAGMLAYLLARAVRWRLLLGPTIRLSRCFWVTNIGYLVSNVFPFRLGDPARAVVVAQSKDMRVFHLWATICLQPGQSFFGWSNFTTPAPVSLLCLNG